MAVHPQVQTMLDAMYAAGFKDVSILPLAEARAQSFAYAQARQLPEQLPLLRVTDHIAELKGRNLTLRLYEPNHKTRQHLLVYYHGGGNVIGNIDQYDKLCRLISTKLGMNLISVGYRLAPESVFPNQIYDGYDALCWMVENQRHLKINFTKLIVAGDSAGAHLATMVSLMARDLKGPKVDFQWLMYPWCDDNFNYPSYQTYAINHSLTLTAMRYFTEKFLPKDVVKPFPAFPAKFTDLSHLPPSYIITAENDVLFDEGKIYAQQLKNAGNKVNYECRNGMIHGFFSHTSML